MLSIPVERTLCTLCTLRFIKKTSLDRKILSTSQWTQFLIGRRLPQTAVSFLLLLKTSNLVKLPQNDSQSCIKEDHFTLKLYVHWKLYKAANHSRGLSMHVLTKVDGGVTPGLS